MANWKDPSSWKMSSFASKCVKRNYLILSYVIFLYRQLGGLKVEQKHNVHYFHPGSYFCVVFTVAIAVLPPAVEKYLKIKIYLHFLACSYFCTCVNLFPLFSAILVCREKMDDILESILNDQILEDVWKHWIAYNIVDGEIGGQNGSITLRLTDMSVNCFAGLFVDGLHSSFDWLIKQSSNIPLNRSMVPPKQPTVQFGDENKVQIFFFNISSII